MPRKDYTDINLDLDKKRYAPVYLLHGTEPYYIDKLAYRFEHHILSAAEKAFNLSILYGKEIDFKAVQDHCRQFPMMSEYRVVIVKEAQTMSDLDKLEAYLSGPSPSTVLVLCHKYKKVDGRKAFSKLIAKSHVIFESKPLYDNQVEGWIANLLTGKGYKFTPGATALMSEHLGNDLLKIEMEVDKLSNNLEAGQVIDEGLIEKYIGISKQYNVFELQRAMGMGDIKKTMTIANYFANNVREVHPVMIVGSLYNYLSKLLIVGMNKKASDKVLQSKLKLPTPYFVREYKGALRFWNGKKVLHALQLLSHYDLKVKGVDNRSTDLSEIVREMIFRLMTA